MEVFTSFRTAGNRNAILLNTGHSRTPLQQNSMLSGCLVTWYILRLWI